MTNKTTSPKSLSLGPVSLNVQNLQTMKDFYHNVMNLDIINESPEKMMLGINEKTLLILHHEPDLSKSHPAHAGLYHFAILFSSQSDLANTIHKIIKQTPHLFSGSADHLVSEAFYFKDPEGNGIELYFDRDRKQWQWENGQVKIATNYLDPIQYIEKHAVKSLTNSAQIGHIHLKVGDIEKAHHFYVNILGFDVTANLPQALFVSVGGYHHHLGLNTWESPGASKRPESLGLKNFEFVFRDKSDLRSLIKRLQENKVEFEENENSVIFSDPWNNQIIARSF